jgi:Outer membrane protein beta-barrel domain
MFYKKAIAVITCVLIMLTVNLGANTLEKRHQIGLNVGMWNQTTDVRTEIGISGVSTSVGTNGATGAIVYGYWFTEGIAMNISVGGMLADVSSSTGTSGVKSNTSHVASILMGTKFYFPPSTFNGSVRPYFKVSAGPYIGSQSSTSVGIDITVESRTEMAIGGQFGLGADFIIGRHFMAGLGFGYNLMTDFDEPIGGSKNYSGPEFNFNFSYLFGKGMD